jgi:dTDP-4-amino-4,6-dideoxygalactose transaminase
MESQSSAEQVQVPFVRFDAMHAPIRDAVLEEIAALIDSGAFINGPPVKAFEERFAEYCDTPLCVGLASGLDALRLSLLAAGVGPGEEVVVPAQTFVATLEAVSQAGATPVLADVSESDLNIDPAAAEAAVTSRTRALLPVHLYGQMADMQRLQQVAAGRGLHLIEDAAQAHGATRDGLRAGSCSLAGCFSFYPGKNLGAFGDAGACTTSDQALADKLIALREHGQLRKYEHEYIGFTSRLDSMQAIPLLHKLELLDEWNEQRRTAAAGLLDGLEGVGDLRLPPVAEGSDPVWHLFVVRTADPEALAQHLRERGVATGRHYPTPVHLTAAYAHLGHAPGDFPVAEALAADGLSLPIFPGMSEAQVGAVVEGVRDYFESVSAAR